MDRQIDTRIHRYPLLFRRNVPKAAYLINNHSNMLIYCSRNISYH